MAVAMASGLKERLGMFGGTGLAMREQTIRYRTPARAGDTIHVRLTVESVTPTPGKERGVVGFGYEILNQRDEQIAVGEWVMVVAARPAPT
jgi:acyl dehydratase